MSVLIGCVWSVAAEDAVGETLEGQPSGHVGCGRQSEYSAESQ